MESKKAALKEILDFVKKLKKDKANSKLKGGDKVEIEVEKEESEPKEEGSVLSSILASLDK